MKINKLLSIAIIAILIFTETIHAKRVYSGLSMESFEIKTDIIDISRRTSIEADLKKLESTESSSYYDADVIDLVLNFNLASFCNAARNESIELLSDMERYQPSNQEEKTKIKEFERRINAFLQEFEVKCQEQTKKNSLSSIKLFKAKIERIKYYKEKAEASLRKIEAIESSPYYDTHLNLMLNSNVAMWCDKAISEASQLLSDMKNYQAKNQEEEDKIDEFEQYIHAFLEEVLPKCEEN